MGFITKGAVLLFLIVIASAALLWYYGRDLQQVSVEDVELNTVEGLDLRGFALDGTIVLNNPSQISVPVEGVDYYIIANDTGDLVAAGALPAFILEKKTMTPIPIKQKINWAPTAPLIIAVLGKEHVYLNVKGYVRMQVPKIGVIALPFEQQIDAKPYFDNFVNTYLPPDIQSILRENATREALDKLQNGSLSAALAAVA